MSAVRPYRLFEVSSVDDIGQRLAAGVITAAKAKSCSASTSPPPVSAGPVSYLVARTERQAHAKSGGFAEFIK